MSVDVEQEGLFDQDAFHVVWREWVGMPEYTHDDLQSWFSMIVHFRNRADFDRFAELLGQKLHASRGAGGGLRSCWYPEEEIFSYADKRWVDA